MFNTLASTTTIEVLPALYSIMLVLTACGCFLAGVNLMSRGFVTLSTKRSSFFGRIFRSRNRFEGITAGFLHSALTQSSDSTAVYAIRLTDLGAITFFQAACAIIGANIGTTITSFFVSLSAFDVTPYFAFLAFIGAIPLLSAKPANRTFGEIVCGFGILFIGISLLSHNVEDENFRAITQQLFTFTDSGIVLILISLALTAVVQSSSVITALVIFFTSASLLPLSSAIYLILGANIGTSVTAWFASIGASRNARRTAMFHTLFNVFGVTIVYVLLNTINVDFFGFVERINIPVEFKISLFHLGFNLFNAIIVLPLIRPFVWFCKKVVKH